jgi:Cu(I)/Ag(I) efflux system protein CusF
MKIAMSTLLITLALSTPIMAQQKSDVTADMTDGEVRKVDVDSAKITLKHAEIKSLEMPAMTMVFNVRDKAMLEKVKAGDKVKFKAVNEGGKFTVTDLQVVH